MRLTLLRVGDAEYYFVWSYLHLLLDGWSTALVLSEVFARYDALLRGTDLHRTQPRPFQDYIAWLRGQDLPAAERFWREVLVGFSTPTPLGIDRIRPPGWQGEDEDYGEEALRLPAATRDALQALARRHQLTLNTVIQGAWAILLSRCAGQEEVVFGVTVAGRPAEFAGVEAMVGPFINTLPLRVRVPPAAPLLPWLHDLQARTVRLRDYEYSPLVEVQGWSDVPRGRPLFDSIFVFDNYPVEPARPWRAGNLEIKDVSSFERTNYPLTVMAAPGPELLLKVLGDRGRFQAGALSRLLGHWQTLLEGIVADPGRRLSDLPLLTTAERRQVLALSCGDRVDYPQGMCLHELVEAQVERTPGAVALAWEGGELTYRQLDDRANRLAGQLRHLGVGPDALVGVCLERGPALVVALLATLKAGGAYVPLDPDHPRDRLAGLLADAGVAAVLTDPGLAGRLPPHSAPQLYLDADGAAEAAAGGDTRGAVGHSGRPAADNLAYVIYTSGSTGAPKGALNTHRGICNRLLWMQDALQLASDDRVLQKTPFSFDVSVWEFFWPLLCGARLVLARPGGQRDSGYLAGLIEATGITTVHFVPSLLAAFLDEPGLERCRDLRRVVCSGEALPAALAARAGERLPGAALYNLYGPTEAAVDVTWAACRPGERRPGMPIGRPIANTQVYVLDRRLRPVPMGVLGELYLGGVGLARGYLNSPALTAVKFIPHPFSDVPGARLYKTGDLARRLADGNLEFLGRLDQQVKVRGFRIELGEVEAALRQHPAVQQAVVLAREDVPGESLLVAYLVAPAAPPASEWRRFLREKLPDYMIPSAFLLLPGLPLTPNGKLDRNARPAPDRARPLAEEAFVAPRTSAEKMLAGIWAEVLGVERVGAHDNFFDLGGHSLKATRVLARCNPGTLSRFICHWPASSTTQRWPTSPRRWLGRRAAVLRIKGRPSCRSPAAGTA